MKYLLTTSGPSPGTDRSLMPGNRRSSSSSGVRSVVQTPVRSGLLSAVVGVGAERFGLPSLVLGTPADGWLIHWACAETIRARQSSTAVAILLSMFPPAV